MARTAMVWNKPTMKLADTLAGLTTGFAVECQLNSAVLTPAPVYNTIPSTGCAGASQSPGLTGWSLDLTWLQDWSLATGLSQYAFANDGLPKYFELVPNSAAPTVKATGQAYVSAGSYGATFGDGSAAQATATWPLLDKPTVTPVYVPPTALREDAADDELVDA